MSCMAWRSDSAALWKASDSCLAAAWAAASAALLAGPPASPLFWLLPACWASLGASGASGWITETAPLDLSPCSPSEVPPRIPPLPDVEGETLAGAK